MALFRPRESNAEKRKHFNLCFNLEEVEKMFVIQRKRQTLLVENVSLEIISVIESKFVIVYCIKFCYKIYKIMNVNQPEATKMKQVAAFTFIFVASTV
jgi:hypothetical protein